jgi:hypothetical protein
MASLSKGCGCRVGIIILSVGGLSTTEMDRAYIIPWVPGLPAPDDRDAVAGEAGRVEGNDMAVWACRPLCGRRRLLAGLDIEPMEPT